MMELDDDILEEYLVESNEHIERLGRDLVELEQNPGSLEIVTRIFRSFHTLKGSSGFFGFEKLGMVAHAAENVLDKMRDGELVLDARVTTVLLETVDVLGAMLASIEKDHHDGTGDHSALISELTAVLEAKRAPVEPAAAPVESAADATRLQAADNSIRIDVGSLDHMMSLVSELVLERNRIVRLAAKSNNSESLESAQKLSQIASRLQDRVMRTRMQPMANLFQKLPRVVRDLSTSLGKKVNVVIRGEETEVDRAILEGLRDPLTHIIRNAIDHGIETPAQRESAGKSGTGTLSVRSYHEGGSIVVEIADDGGGISLEKVKKKAIERGLIDAARAGQMSEREAIRLIFAPGLSTAEAITNVSGRGVGLDVVRSNIERLNGSIDVISTLSVGTVMELRIPLTTGILPALVVHAGRERFALPRHGVREIVRLRGDRAASETFEIDETRVFCLRGSLLPLIDLADVLELEGGLGLSSSVDIVVMKTNTGSFGLVVDSTESSEELVVKPIAPALRSVGFYSGATILGDGRVALILDVLALAEAAKVGLDATVAAEALVWDELPPDREPDRWLLFALDEERCGVVPFASVLRLEELPRASIEKLGARDVVQWSQQIVPLVFLSPEASADTLQVVVCAHAGKPIALAVDRILDLVAGAATVPENHDQKSLSTPIILRSRVTELFDVGAILSTQGG